MECCPPVVGKAVTDAVRIPVIGIGAGPDTSGQVLVYHDLLGLMSHPHHEKYVPSFCKKYADLGININKALLEYNAEVKSGAFPSKEYCPYKMPPEEEQKFASLLVQDSTQRDLEAVQVDKKLTEADEYAVIKLY